MTEADLARSLAAKLEDCVIPDENRRIVRLTLLHLSRCIGDPFFSEEAALLRDMLAD